VELFILRHGKAEAHGLGGDDAARALTGPGRDEIKKVARWTMSMGYTFDVIATSPLKRAMETAEIFCLSTRQEHPPEVWDVLATGGNPAALSEQVGRLDMDCSVLIIGHEPLLSIFIGHVISGSNRTSVLLAKGGFARIKNVSSNGGLLSGDLHSLITPKQIPAEK
jgi:phosphohistidine phosphatase